MLDMRTNYVETPLGLILPEAVADAYMESLRPPPRPKAISLFAGIGGFDLGFIQAGYEVVAASEWDAMAAITFMANLCRYGEFTIHYVEPSDQDRLEKALKREWKRAEKSKKIEVPCSAGSGWISHQPDSVPHVSHFFFGDVRKLTGQRMLDTIGMKKGEVDCVTGGPPCQGYSMGGRRNVMDPRNSLVFEFARMILEINPKTFIFENVPGIVSMVTPEHVPVLDKFCQIIQEGSFATFDALKAAMEKHPGASGVIRTRKSPPKEPKPPKENEPDIVRNSCVWDTREEWISLCMARLVDQGHVDQTIASEIAVELAQDFQDENADAEMWDDPEDTADDEMSTWD